MASSNNRREGGNIGGGLRTVRIVVGRTWPPPVFGSKWGLPTPLVARPETLRWWEVEVEDMFWCGVGLESAVGRGPLGRSSENGPIVHLFDPFAPLK